MVMIEMRENAYDTAFELLEEAKHSAKKTKLTLCELEDAMYDCYETSKDSEEEEPEVDFRNYRHDYDEEDEEYKPQYRRGMRSRYGMRAGMRMRRNRMGRFA